MIDQRIKLLIVEDNELDMEKISRSMKRLKISNEIFRAENGLVALEFLQGTNGRDKIEAPCLVFLDLNMPKMDGFEFLRVLRADPDIAFTPVFVLSTSERQRDVDEAYDLNVSGYIVKPVTVSQMMEALSTLESFWTLCKSPSARKLPSNTDAG